ncbi:MAG TPA: cytochrome c biogenesis protein CcdA, partial [Desulfuromonadales bacterium]|nr:cytochrome c biogenesis protein CcdA [Desulfuromonadales bacterium]
SRQRIQVLLSAFLFVMGFSLVFVMLGASATWLGSLAASHLSLLGKISGGVIIFFGLLKLGVVKTRWFLRDTRFLLNVKKRNAFVALLLGMAFAFGWTPCVGPILGAILTYAGTVKNVDSGVTLLMVYSAGLGIPFLLTALFIQYFIGFFNKIKKYLGLIERVTGVVLIVMGWLIFSGSLTRLTYWLTYFNRFSL